MAHSDDGEEEFDPVEFQTVIDRFHYNTTHDIQTGTAELEGRIHEMESKVADLGDIYMP